MESKGWIIPLGVGTDTVHVREESVRPGHESSGTPLVGVQSKKRVVDDVEEEKGRTRETLGIGKENRYPGYCDVQRHKSKKVKIDKGVLRGRPMLQDVMNDVS